MRSITCQNSQGSRIVFQEDDFAPFVLAHVDGIYNTENAVTIAENTMVDGGTYQGSRAKVRNIVLTVMHRPSIRYAMRQRDELRELFLKDDYGTLIYTEDGVSRKTNYYVEYIRPVKGKPLYLVSLRCPDPFFYAEYDNTVTLAAWLPGFRFPHQFKAEGEPIGTRSVERIGEVVNDNAADNIGLTITFHINGDVRNPNVTRIESDETMQIGHADKPLSLVSGDKVIVTTGIGDKHVYLVHDGIRTEINEYLTEDSKFIQLMRGPNHFGYDAEAGVDNIVLSIGYRLKYEGC